MGHEPRHLSPHRLFIPAGLLLARLNVRTGYRLFSRRIDRGIRRLLQGEEWDLVWVDSCAELPPSTYRWLQSRGKPIVSYVLDNPFVTRDHRKWDLYKKSLPYHDLSVFSRKQSVRRAGQMGARRPVALFMGYDPVAHHPSRAGNIQAGSGGLVFVGTWMPERGSLMVRLAKAGLPLRIHGNDWPRAREWSQLQPFWAGPSIYGADYVRAIREARIALGLLSKGNQDLHTTRSLEVPFIGGAAFCSERTADHQRLYREGQEALFWEDADECVRVCRRWIAQPEPCRSIAARGSERVRAAGLSNDEILAGVLRLLRGEPFSRGGIPLEL